MKKKIISIILGIVLLILVFKDADMDKIMSVYKKGNYLYLIIATVFFGLTAFIRSLQWQLILSPLEKVSQKVIFPITAVGFYCILILPMRMGELVRPFLVSQRYSKITFSSAVATVVVDRIADMFLILICFLVSLFFVRLPDILIEGIYIISLIIIVAIAFVILFYFKPTLTLNLTNRLLKFFPEWIRTKICGILERFREGFAIITDFKKVFYTIFYSLILYSCSFVGIYFLFLFTGLDLTIYHAVLVNIIVVIGVSVVSVPGFIGSFQFACALALSLFGVNQDLAAAFSIVYYVSATGIAIVIGLISLSFVNFSLHELKDKILTLKNKEAAY